MNKQQELRDKRRNISELKNDINESLKQIHALCNEQSAKLSIHEDEDYMDMMLDGTKTHFCRPPYISISITRNRRVAL